MAIQIESQMADAPQAQTQSNTGTGIGAAIGTAIMPGVGTLVGAGAGYLAGKIFGTDQVTKQGQLDAQQLQYNEQMANFNYNQQMQMWHDTNYSAQVAEAEKAGLNPALLYAKGGMGGSTAVNAGNVSAPAAANAAQMLGAQSGMSMQLEQAKVMEAQARLLDAQTAKTQQEVPNVQANTENTQANTALTQANTELAKIQQQIQGKSIEYQIQTIAAGADTAMANARTTATNANIAEATQNTTIKQIQQNYINSILTAALTKSNIQVNQEEVANMANQIVNRDWQTKINQQQQNTNQQNTELQHQDRSTDMQQQLNNWDKWHQIAETELVLQGMSKVLQAAEGGSVGTSAGGKQVYYK